MLEKTVKSILGISLGSIFGAIFGGFIGGLIVFLWAQINIERGIEVHGAGRSVVGFFIIGSIISLIVWIISGISTLIINRHRTKSYVIKFNLIMGAGLALIVWIWSWDWTSLDVLLILLIIALTNSFVSGSIYRSIAEDRVENPNMEQR